MDAAALPPLDGLDVEALKALLLQQQERHRKALSTKTERIEHLELMVEKLRRMLFGAKSEKAAIQLLQLELELEELVIAQASAEMAEAKSAEAAPQPELKTKPFRKPLPEHLPREVVTYLPEYDYCPGCGVSVRPSPLELRGGAVALG